jgi:hypothetical protein
MTTTRKKVVSGNLQPRWPKPRVVRWLEWGAVPAIAGLWLPDWAGAYIAEADGGAWTLPGVAFPPVLTFLGAVILLKACWEGIRDMGRHYRGLRISGGLALAFAGASLPLHFLRTGTGGDPWFAAEILAIGLAAFFATGFFWFTIAKVAEITVETRTEITKTAVLAVNAAALAAGAVTVATILFDSPLWPDLLRATVALFTVAFLLCRYAVHCYKTQRSIGASFVAAPDQQFWV